MSYGQYRKKLVPHMREVVFYPDAKDAFDIAIREGVQYFLICKDTYRIKKIKNICSLQKFFNDTAERHLCNDDTLFNIGQEIIGYLKDYDKLKFNNLKEYKEYIVVTCNDIVIGGRQTQRYFIYNKSGSQTFLGPSDILKKDETYFIKGVQAVSYTQNSVNECKSFIQYLDCKFTRFFLAINISSRSDVITNHYFRFVPSPMVLDEQGNRVPGKFDHTYTDEELYKTWNLPQKYIDVIEAVIKERK